VGEDKKGEGDDIVVKAWARQAVIGIVAVVVAVYGVVTTLDTRFVNKKEHEEHETNDKVEVARIDATLLRHMSDTRTESVRLSVIEAQLGTIQRQLEVMDAKLDRAASRKDVGLVR
jgi:hypothetical protein